MSLEHACLPIEDQGVAEARNLNLVPSLTEDYVTLHDLVLKGSPETTFTCSLFDMLLYLAADATDSTDLCACELCDLELAVEHALDEGGVFVDLIRLSDELKLLHDLELAIHLNH